MTDTNGPPAIAVIGLSGRFPGAADPSTLWANLRAGAEAITFFTDEHLLAAGESPDHLLDPAYVKACGRLSDIAEFDAGFFGMSPRDAAVFDPQHRVFLECAWEAFEDAGYVGERFAGPVGVFASSGGAEYLMYNLLRNRQVMESVGAWLVRHNGNDPNFLATRVSYELNLNGPSMSVQTACSSSLVAVHVACQSLLNGECDIALAGGSTIYSEQNRGYFFKEGEILSPDGHCRAFDAASAGTVMGSAVGCVVLRRLEDAVRDGDQILAIIRGSAVNNDGAQKVGYLAPSVTGQARVVSEALAIAGIHPEEVSYIEAHGTGTPIGDPIEIAALTQAFRAATDKKQFCAVGSLKTNLGHTGEAAGICGLIKTVLSLRHRELPPSLHYRAPNPQIDFANSPFFVNASLREWTVPRGKSRIAGVTSLGAGGTNVHVLVEEAPRSASTDRSREYQLLVLSAKTQGALDRATQNLAAHLRTHPELDIADAAFTLLAGRRHFPHRRGVVVKDVADSLTALEAPDRKRLLTQYRKQEDPPSLLFMFPGGGAQYARMGAELYEREPAYREPFDEALSQLEPIHRAALRAVAFAKPAEAEAASARLESPALALPALLATEYAIARLLSSWGIVPTAMVGHSAGEYSAACLAGVITVRDAMALVALRGRLFETLRPGGMLSVALPEQEARAWLGPDLSLAAINAPAQCVLSGPVAAIAAVEAELRSRNIECTRVHIQVAAHSAMVDPILDEFDHFCRTIAFGRPRIPFVSNVTGTWITDAEATDPAYWVRHLRSTVRFSDGVQTLLARGEGAFCEIGPGRTLSSLVRQQHGTVATVAPTLRHPQEEASDLAFLLGAVGRLWVAGVPLDESRFFAGQKRRRVTLPTYPFERQRYWVDPDPSDGARERTVALRKRPDMREWFYASSWGRSAPPAPAAARMKARWLVLTNHSTVDDALVAGLRGAGHVVVEVEPADGFAALGDLRYAVNPATRGDFDALMKELREREALPQRVLHLWALTPRLRRSWLPWRLASSDSWDALRTYHRGLSLNYFSLIFLVQAFAAHAETLRVFCVSSHLQSVSGDADVQADKAVLLGPCKVIPREYPGVACISIDVPWPGSASEQQALATRLLNELEGESPDGEVALRGADRWVRRFDAVSLGAVVERPWLREGGVYVVTGGLGGIGLSVAEHLARCAHVKLALIGRTPLPPAGQFDEWVTSHPPNDEASRRIAVLRAIRAHGAEVMTIAADAADVEAMRAALKSVRARFGAVHGVFHAAGVLKDELLALRAPAAASEVIDAKMKAALVLDALLGADPLDVFVLFSSVSSILGLPGQADYTAANAFLDAFAEARAQRRPGRTLSINWNAWQDVGMLASRVRNERLARREHEARPNGEQRSAHPALGTVVSDDETATLFRVSLRRSGTWLLAEHVVRGGDALISGTGFLEIARAALEHHKEERAVELRDVVFLAPFAVGPEQERTLHVRIERDGERAFSCYAESETDPFVMGKAGYVDAPAPQRVDLAAISRRCTRSGEVAGNQLVQHFMDFGPRWGSVKRIDLGSSEALLSLELPAAFAADVNVYPLHPALLDLATGGAQALVPGFDPRTTFHVPFSYERVLLRCALPPRLFSHVHLRDSSTKDSVVFDATLFDERGEEVASIEGFVMRRVAPGFVVLAPADTSRVEGIRRTKVRPVTAAEVALREGMTPAEGVEALDRMLAQDFSPQVVACTVPLHQWIDRLAEEARNAAADVSGTGAGPALPVFARPNVSAAFAPPRDALERELASLWSGLLGVADPGVHDDFFELGGHSLVAVRFFQRIGQTYGIELPLATLFQAPTIAECAALLRERLGLSESDDARPVSSGAIAPAIHAMTPAFRSLVLMRGGDRRRTPFFCVHGALGNVLPFRDLTRAMDPKQPVYGLQASGTDGVSPLHTTIEEMASAYVAEVREVQPHGPYLLAGYSGGGIVAFEMAQQLTASGEEVGVLALIDTFHPQMPGFTRLERLRMRLRLRTRLDRVRREGVSAIRSALDRRRKIAQEAREARAIERERAPGEPVPFFLREHALFRNFELAARQYRPKPWPGRAILFRAEEQHAYMVLSVGGLDYFLRGRGPAYGWDRDILGGVEIVTVPGNHQTLLGTNVHLLVRALDAAIERASANVITHSRAS